MTTNESNFQMNEQILNSKPSQCPEELWNLIQKSLNCEPNHRPTFKEIIQKLENEIPEQIRNTQSIEEDKFIYFNQE